MTDEPAPVSRWLAISIACLLSAGLLLTSTMPPGLYGFGGIPPFDAKRLLELAALPLILAIVLLDGSLRSAAVSYLLRIPSWLALALLALFGLGVISSLFNAGSREALANSLADVALLALPVAALFCLAACRDIAGRSFDRVVGGAMVLIALAVGLQEILGVFAARNAGLEFNFYLALPNFHFPRFYNQMQSWMMPATVAVVLLFPGRRLAVVLVACALASHWYVMLATGARGTLMGVVLSTAFCVAVFPRTRWLLLRYQVASLLAGLVLFLGLVVIGDSPANATAAAVPDTRASQDPYVHGSSLGGALTGERMLTSTGRIDLWRDAIGYAAERPLLGIGPGNYACGGWRTRPAHPHSFPFRVLSEWGVPAFVIVLLIAGFVAWSALLQLRKAAREPTPPDLATLLFGAVLAAALLACVDGVLLMPASQMIGVLVGGWLLAALPNPVPHNVPNSVRRVSWVLPVALAFAVGFAIYGWRDFDVRQQRYQDSPAWQIAVPRFWHNGKVCPPADDAANS